MTHVLARLEAIARASGDRRGKAREAAECIRAARGYHWVGLYDVTPSHITAIAWTGPNAPAHPTFPRAQGLNGVAVRTGAAVVVQDIRKDPRYLTTFGVTLAEAVFPVVAGEHGVVGTIDVESDQVDAFKAEAGKRRAFETSKSEETAADTQLELLTFIIAGEQYAVDIERIVIDFWRHMNPG